LLISIIVLALTVAYWQWMPSVLFVSYLAYGLVRPWVSRKWRHEIEDGNDPALDENGVSPEVIDEHRDNNAKTDPASLI
jgi:CDP-diacylglycerol--serine O-phosphatidyltransferase